MKYQYMIFYFGYIFLLSHRHVCCKRTLEHKLRTWEVLNGDDIAIGRGRRSADGKHYTYDKEVGGYNMLFFALTIGSYTMFR